MVHRTGWVAGATVLLTLLGCRDRPGPPGAVEVPRFDATASSARGMVVTGSPYATEAGIRILEAGGNAVDAAVAAAFALAVAEPTQSGLGGRTQLLVFMADGTVHGIDGTTQVPAGYDPASAPQGEHGHGAVGIPGTVAALARALDEHGSLSLATVLAPALSWARDGIALPAGEAERIAAVASELDPASELGRILLGPEGAPPPAGALLLQPDLAGVLQSLAAEGPDVFYRGEIALRMADDMAAHGGFVTVQDLADFRAVDAEVGHGRFAGRDVWGSYLPASGVTIIEILQVLDRIPLEGADEARWAAAVVESLLAGFEDRELAEAMEPASAVAWLTSDTLADRRASVIARTLRQMAMAGLDPGESVPALAMDDGREPAFTTHVSVADTFGNVVALTQSLGPTLGARVVTPGLGFVYASTLGGYLTGGGPGYRPWSSQAPVVLTVQGRPELVIGGAGARRILSALITTLSRTLQSGDDLEVALAARRLHATGGQVELQEGWAVGGELTAFGYEVRERETSYFARLNAVAVLPDGTFRGVGEPRWTESAAGGPRR
ncbi:MAG TPA: gamma-glutamyltransferase [Longimicrobiales bacterium]|nr:gamma-glutamyltransferase [Longimicrobiales bacterium]